ncbi:MAG: hypothetical protein DHS20C18_11900 [Saprospiraceae bacterium]|nr:MAG: hypothetical protein DHS20C18_11900 [Saprospiraceae bacterium]
MSSPKIFGVTILIVAGIFLLTRYFLRRQLKGEDYSLVRQLVLAAIIFVGIGGIILAVPVSEDNVPIKLEVLGILGIIISSAIALSATSILGNALASLQLRSAKSFKPGDFIKINDFSGKVSKRGLFYVEIQTPKRNLINLPNLFLANNPLEVTPEKKPLITTTVSLGYDVPHTQIAACLLDAADRAKLVDTFVYITELGDFSVVYQISGCSKDNERLLTHQSMLNEKVLDVLHEAKIEIVSPAFMNQRQVNKQVFIPKKQIISDLNALEPESSPEDILFDRAILAGSIEKKKEKFHEVLERIKEIEKHKQEADTTEQEKLDGQLTRAQNFKQELEKQIQEDETKLKN